MYVKVFNCSLKQHITYFMSISLQVPTFQEMGTVASSAHSCRQNFSYNRWSTFTVICNIFLQRWMFTSLSGPEFRLFFHHKQHTTWISTTEHLNCNRNFFTLTGKHPSNRVTAKYWNCWSINPHQHEDEVSGETPAGKPRGKRELWWDPSGRGKTEILYWTKETYIEREKYDDLLKFLKSIV